MLSVPRPSFVSGAKISSSNSATGVLWFVLSYVFFASFISIFFTASSFVRQSQMPSQARIINLSVFLRLNSVISGSQVTAYSSGFKFLWSLNWKSPKALLSAKLPSTLEISTVWLAFSILLISIGLSGLWSSLSS